MVNSSNALIGKQIAAIKTFDVLRIQLHSIKMPNWTILFVESRTLQNTVVSQSNVLIGKQIAAIKTFNVQESNYNQLKSRAGSFYLLNPEP